VLNRLSSAIVRVIPRLFIWQGQGAAQQSVCVGGWDPHGGGSRLEMSVPRGGTDLVHRPGGGKMRKHVLGGGDRSAVAMAGRLSVPREFACSGRPCM
jgi:hypothetical protein